MKDPDLKKRYDLACEELVREAYEHPRLKGLVLRVQFLSALMRQEEIIDRITQPVHRGLRK